MTTPETILIWVLLGSNWAWYVTFHAYRKEVKKYLKERGIIND